LVKFLYLLVVLYVYEFVSGPTVAIVLYVMELFLEFKFQSAIECGIMELCMEWCGITWNWYGMARLTELL